MTIAGALALSILVAWWLLAPLVRGTAEAAPEFAGTREALLDQRDRCRQVLKDLDLDFAMGKVPEGDYEITRQRLTAELAGILEKLDTAPARAA